MVVKACEASISKGPQLVDNERWGGGGGGGGGEG